ncbi:MAG: BREX-2 system adenine-specific DNA-methyltransferase PglX, partial [Planctomycetota bacterium]
MDIKALLPELKKQVNKLSDDLLARVTTEKEIKSSFVEVFEQIKKSERTAQAFEVWLEDYLDQVAVAWVLSCVFVRFLEDNELIEQTMLSGDKDRIKQAKNTHEEYFKLNPFVSDREYFLHVFTEVGKIPAAKDLFAQGKTPLWAVGPSGDCARELLQFWQEVDPDTGNLKRTFVVPNNDTRFLGDLYQDLSERARKKYALLQTPDFVEEFILDRTLTPAIQEFGFKKVRMIDPTCGSGHFILGGFSRLFELWIKEESNVIIAVQKALDGVFGVDLNPFAVAIARFRLIIAALQACGFKKLKEARQWKINLAVGDSLLFGSDLSWDGARNPIQHQQDFTEINPIYAVEDRSELQRILGQGYHAVVGNPPYITVKDKVMNESYRVLYSTCHRRYSLSAPFAQKFWQLALHPSETKSGGGYVGQITSNSFMKREFGKKLIEEFFPKIDLTYVMDTSGAYIPAHGTPTVILFGRNQKPLTDTVRAVLGIKGEPSTPANPSQGLVWQSILKHIDRTGEQDEFTSSTDIPRVTFGNHPWSIGGGGASDLKEFLDEQPLKLEDFTDSIGFMSIPGDEDVFISASASTWKRHNIAIFLPMVTGDGIRD